ncbi:hypothetical protein FOXYSP1_09422 [Fusarium oxysporum f. sp. phaseoli]
MCLINIDDIDWKKGKKQILQKGPCLKIPVQNSRSQLKCLVHVQKHEMQGEHHVEMKQKQNVLSVNLSLSQVVVAPKGDNWTSLIAHLFTTPVTDHPFQNHDMRRAATPTVCLPVAFVVAVELRSSSEEPTTTLSYGFARQPKLYCSIFFSYSSIVDGDRDGGGDGDWSQMELTHHQQQMNTRGGAARSVEGFTAVPRRRVGVNDQLNLHPATIISLSRYCQSS